MLTRAIALGVFVALFTGCANNVTYYHKTVVGFDLAIEPEDLKGHLVAGYSRKLEADIPEVTADSAPATEDDWNRLTKKEKDAIRRTEGEAQSMLACSSISIRLFDLKVRDRIATGEAAKNYARRYQDGTRAFQCMRPAPRPESN